MPIGQVRKLISNLRLNGGIIIDDNTPTKSEYKIEVVNIRKVDGEEVVIPLFSHDRFPISKIYLGEEGRPHMKLISKDILSTEAMEALQVSDGLNVEI